MTAALPQTPPEPESCTAAGSSDFMQPLDDYINRFGRVPPQVLKVAPIVGTFDLLLEACGKALKDNEPISDWLPFVQSRALSAARVTAQGATAPPPPHAAPSLAEPEAERLEALRARMRAVLGCTEDGAPIEPKGPADAR